MKLKSKNCPQCGGSDLKEVGDGYICNFCGAKLSYSRESGSVIVVGSVCPKCGTANSKEDIFCGSCRFLLIRDCPFCGSKYEFWRKFCGKCGRKVVKEYIDFFSNFNRWREYSIRILNIIEERKEKALSYIKDTKDTLLNFKILISSIEKYKDARASLSRYNMIAFLIRFLYFIVFASTLIYIINDIISYGVSWKYIGLLLLVIIIFFIIGKVGNSYIVGKKKLCVEKASDILRDIRSTAEKITLMSVDKFARADYGIDAKKFDYNNEGFLMDGKQEIKNTDFNKNNIHYVDSGMTAEEFLAKNGEEIEFKEGKGELLPFGSGNVGVITSHNLSYYVDKFESEVVRVDGEAARPYAHLYVIKNNDGYQLYITKPPSVENEEQRKIRERWNDMRKDNNMKKVIEDSNISNVRKYLILFSSALGEFKKKVENFINDMTKILITDFEKYSNELKETFDEDLSAYYDKSKIEADCYIKPLNENYKELEKLVMAIDKHG